jgi:hypothetical protein
MLSLDLVEARNFPAHFGHDLVTLAWSKPRPSILSVDSVPILLNEKGPLLKARPAWSNEHDFGHANSVRSRKSD